jgi:hypothetical protein
MKQWLVLRLGIAEQLHKGTRIIATACINPEWQGSSVQCDSVYDIKRFYLHNDMAAGSYASSCIRRKES